MKLLKATYERDGNIPFLSIETDLGTTTIDHSGLKMEILEQGMVYVGFSDQLPELPFTWDEDGEVFTESLSGFTNDPEIIKLVHKFLNGSYSGIFKNGDVLFQG